MILWNPSNHLEKSIAKSQRNPRCPEETPKIIISDNVTLCLFGYEGEKKENLEERSTVDGRNPANHLGCMKLYKHWNRLPNLNWLARSFPINISEK